MARHTKPGKLYFTFFGEPRAPFEIPAMKNRLTRAYRLADKAPVELKTENGRTTFTMERADARSDGHRRRGRVRRDDRPTLIPIRFPSSSPSASRRGDD